MLPALNPIAALFTASTRPNSRTLKKARNTVSGVGPRTKIGGRDVKLDDLVIIDDPKHTRKFLARVTGAYQQGNVWRLHLGPAPYGPNPPLQSTKLHCVRQTFRRTGPKMKAGWG